MDVDTLSGQDSLEIFTPTLFRKVAAMLDLYDPVPALDTPLPRGWHFALLPATTRRSELRADGFAGLGVELPDLGLPRLLLAGRTVSYHGDLSVGSVIQRQSHIDSIEEKGGESPRAVVRISHALRNAASGRLMLMETQTFMMLPVSGRYRAPDRPAQPIEGQTTLTLVPDATLLFQFSALGFNAHKIHLDRDYARNVEGFPDLVVNGGLTALLVTEFARQRLAITLESLDVKYLAPLFCDRALTIAATLAPDETHAVRWRINVHDDAGRLAATALAVAK